MYAADDSAVCQRRLSGPLLDRIDIHIEVPAVQYKELRGGSSAAEGSAEIRERVTGGAGAATCAVSGGGGGADAGCRGGALRGRCMRMHR